MGASIAPVGLDADEAAVPNAPRKHRARRHFRCLDCGAPIDAVTALETGMFLCGDCQAAGMLSALAWRVVYDRDAHIGEIPANLLFRYPELTLNER
jgi:hypothetical protein